MTATDLDGVAISRMEIKNRPSDDMVNFNYNACISAIILVISVVILYIRRIQMEDKMKILTGLGIGALVFISIIMAAGVIEELLMIPSPMLTATSPSFSTINQQTVTRSPLRMAVTQKHMNLTQMV